METKRRSVDELIAALPLKEMEASLLGRSIVTFARTNSLDVDAFTRAIDFASYCHRAQLRQNRGKMPLVHYVEHPLRNCLRLARFGVADTDTLLAAILHDTVEDCAFEIAQDIAGATVSTEADARAAALAYIGREFGATVQAIVHALSNPIPETKLGREESNLRYVEHVLEAIKEPRAFLAKFTDFVDNALSLHHTVNQAMVQKLARKYLPLAEPLLQRLNDADLRAFVDPVGIELMQAQLGRHDLAAQAS